MKDMNKHSHRVVMTILIVAIGIATYMGFQLTDSFSNEDVFGEIQLLHEGEVSVGNVVPMVFLVPDPYDDLHKEMWDCYQTINGERDDRMNYMIEYTELLDFYSEEEIASLFFGSPVPIQSDENTDDRYTPRIALFTPREPGAYVISVAGYYRSTSPSEYGTLEVIVQE